jgi:hypothetical protein
MAITVSGSLNYGVDLGNADAWQFTEIDHTGAPTLAWFDPAGTDDDDFAAQAHRVLLTGSGEPGLDRADWCDLQNAAAAHAGVAVDRYSWQTRPKFVLAAHTTTAFYDRPVEVDLADLDRRRVSEGWDDRITAALAQLGITPTIARPRWLLTAAE